MGGGKGTYGHTAFVEVARSRRGEKRGGDDASGCLPSGTSEHAEQGCEIHRG